MQTVLFHRDFRQFSGGHLKVWDYFNHVRACEEYRACIYFSPQTVWDQDNPWLALKDQALPSWGAVRPDLLFLAGLDWLALEEAQRVRPPVPVINLIQHVQHALSDDPRFAFLPHRAIRLCVSEEVAEAIRGTGRVNGPVFTIPNGLQTAPLLKLASECPKEQDLVIAALKQPKLGEELLLACSGLARHVELLTQPLPRDQFLRRLACARVALLLPLPTEGCYLPALEAMALGAVVVCPDCVGNRSFCLPRLNSFRPGYTRDQIVAAVAAALRLPEAPRSDMLNRALQTVLSRDLLAERQAFVSILQNIRQLW